MAAALIQFDENFVPDLLSKNYVLLRLLIKCGSYKSAATNTVFTVFVFSRQNCLNYEKRTSFASDGGQVTILTTKPLGQAYQLLLVL